MIGDCLLVALDVHPWTCNLYFWKILRRIWWDGWFLAGHFQLILEISYFAKNDVNLRFKASHPRGEAKRVFPIYPRGVNFPCGLVPQTSPPQVPCWFQKVQGKHCILGLWVFLVNQPKALGFAVTHGCKWSITIWACCILVAVPPGFDSFFSLDCPAAPDLWSLQLFLQLFLEAWDLLLQQGTLLR